MKLQVSLLPCQMPQGRRALFYVANISALFFSQNEKQQKLNDIVNGPTNCKTLQSYSRQLLKKNKCVFKHSVFTQRKSGHLSSICTHIYLYQCMLEIHIVFL